MNDNWLWDRDISDSRAKKILKEPGAKAFVSMAALLLSRKNNPREVFKNYLNPLAFCKNWAAIKRKMRRDKWSNPRIVFWQAIYENLAATYHKKGFVFREKASRIKNPLCQQIGKNISEMRKAKGLSQKDLAGKLGISQQLISRIEKGGENVSLITLGNIARAFDKKVDVEFVA